MKVIWSASAKRNFRRTIDYLMEEWTEKEAKNFTSKIDKLVQNIKSNISFCPPSKINRLRKCLIDKNNSLIYLFENEAIYIVTIIDNRSAHPY